MCRPLAFVVTSVTDRNEHVAAQADSSLSNRRASLSRSLATDVSVDRRHYAVATLTELKGSETVYLTILNYISLEAELHVDCSKAF